MMPNISIEFYGIYQNGYLTTYLQERRYYLKQNGIHNQEIAVLLFNVFSFIPIFMN